MCPTLKTFTTMSIGKQIGLGAATSAIDSVFNVGTGLLMNKIQYEQQKELMDKSYDQQLDFWREQTAYNDPASQVARLKKAGLNPALINSNGVNNVAGGLSSVGAPSPPPVQPGHTNVAQSAQALQSILKMAEETGFIDTQNKVMAQELINKIINNEIQTIARNMKLDEAEIKRLEKLSSELDFEGKYQFAFNRPSTKDGEMLANNPLVIERDRLQNESNARVALFEAETSLNNTSKELAEAQLKFAHNRESREAEQHVADLALKTAQQVAAYAQASYASQQAKHTSDSNSREAEQHSMNLAIDELRKSSILSDSQINALKARVEEAWTQGVFGPDAKGRRWDNFEYIVNDFFHNNLNLSGSGSVSKSSH